MPVAELPKSEMLVYLENYAQKESATRRVDVFMVTMIA